MLRGEKCLSPKCPQVRRPYAPGQKKKKTHRVLSEYGKQLIQKQKLKNYYGLREKQFQKYVKSVLYKRGGVQDAAVILVKNLEKRLDNVIFRAGFVRSRREARQLVSHSHFLINGKPVNAPSFEAKKSVIIALKENKKNKPIFKNLGITLKNYQPPKWLKVDKEKLEVEVIDEPASDDIKALVDIPTIFEFYSR